ncbi:MAG: baseplate J/gp47 family protein [bacterium]
MSYGLTSAGFVPKTLDIIQAEIDEALKSNLGAHLNTLPESVFGQLKGTFSERETLLWELAEAVYNSQYPASAEGVNLDNAASLTGLTRLPAIASTVVVQLTGTEGTAVPAGTVFSVSGNPSIKFATNADVTIGSGPTNAACTAIAAGPLVANAGTMTVIDNPIAGLTSVTNPEDAIVGRNTETDAEFRIRRNNRLQISLAGPLEAIRSAVLELNEDSDKPGIETVRVFENYTNEIDSRGLPPKSFEVIVYQAGGVTSRDQEIADAIFAAKPAGIESCGNISMTVSDSQGFSHPIKFSRPVDVDIYLELDLTVTSAYPADGDNQIKALLVSWGNALGAGQDVIVYPALIGQLATIPGITDVVVRIGTAPDPALDDNIDIDDGTGGTVELSRWDTSRITITS